MTTAKIPTEQEVLGYMTSLSNWGRWGPDDMLGTLNLITPKKRAQAARLVRQGITVSCARPILPDLTADVTSIPPIHYMTSSGETVPATGAGGTGDFVGIVFHGLSITHIDTPSHQFWNGKMFNGKPAAAVTAQQRATVGGVDLVKDGILTRGVLLDIAALKGKPWLEAGEAVFPEDLEAAEKAQGVHLGEGDALLVRMGWYKRRVEVGPPTAAQGRPGLHASTLPWLHKRGISIALADASWDAGPSGYAGIRIPVHTVGIVFMGLWLIDAGNCEEVVEVCRRLNQWEFMFVVAPLRWPNATGSPVSPLAVF
ncbi:MAG: cyclase family protein [Chloroflexota bacterium]